jgi:hypothetical protein
MTSEFRLHIFTVAGKVYNKMYEAIISASCCLPSCALAVVNVTTPQNGKPAKHRSVATWKKMKSRAVTLVAYCKGAMPVRYEVGLEKKPTCWLNMLSVLNGVCNNRTTCKKEF